MISLVARCVVCRFALIARSIVKQSVQSCSSVRWLVLCSVFCRVVRWIVPLFASIVRWIVQAFGLLLFRSVAFAFFGSLLSVVR